MRTLDRILAVLDAVAAGATGPTDTAGRVGLSLPTVARMMRDLADSGLLYRSEPTGEYRLGPRLITMARSALRGGWLLEMALSTMQELRDRSEETVSLHVPFGLNRVCLGSVEGPHPLRRVVADGLTLPITTGATGKALLAHLPGSIQTDCLNTLSSKERSRLECRLDAIREAGFGHATDEWFEGVAAIAAPVFSGADAVAVVSVSGPTSRWTNSKMLKFAPHLLAGAEAISERLTSSGERLDRPTAAAKAPPLATSP